MVEDQILSRSSIGSLENDGNVEEKLEAESLSLV